MSNNYVDSLKIPFLELIVKRIVKEMIYFSIKILFVNYSENINWFVN